MKSNIKVSRYVDKQLGWEACITPEDGSWCLFIPRLENGKPLVPFGAALPQLWIRVGTCVDEHGEAHESFSLAGSPDVLAFIADNFGNGMGPAEAYDQAKLDATRARLEAEYAAAGIK